ncbi:hypothetical protein MHH56_09520 [Paenibacillus sp. FSL K6-3182]|uniref:hypothetical protein n=1 Tax=Paenibacillus sp. FSL K6-3182 TaxID=2921495 RepID=UPI0030CD19E6
MKLKGTEILSLIFLFTCGVLIVYSFFFTDGNNDEINNANNQLEQQSIDIASSKFINRFNEIAVAWDQDIRIGEPTIKQIDNTNSFRYDFNKGLYLEGKTSNNNNEIKSIETTLIFNNDTAQNVVDFSVSGNVIVSIFSPELSIEERRSVMYDLGFKGIATKSSYHKSLTIGDYLYFMKVKEIEGLKYISFGMEQQ